MFIYIYIQYIPDLKHQEQGVAEPCLLQLCKRGCLLLFARFAFFVLLLFLLQPRITQAGTTSLASFQVCLLCLLLFCFLHAAYPSVSTQKDPKAVSSAACQVYLCL